LVKTFSVQISTIDKKVYSSREVESIVVPGWDGYLGVLYNHAPILCVLRTGAIKLKENNEERIFAVSDGLMKTEDNNVVIFVESAERIDEIDKTRAERALERALTYLRTPGPGVDM
jgi:F-type H+-transporting ATPase subunit epsilon